VADSLRAEQGEEAGEDYGRKVGTNYCWLTVMAVIPFVAVVTGVAAFILWIIYWVKMSGYRKALSACRREVRSYGRRVYG
jgi:hypothetical protein